MKTVALKKIFTIALTACSFLIIAGALSVPLFLKYNVPFSGAFYDLYHRLCTANASHCFSLSGYLIPLCARCLGIYSGIFFTFTLYFENIKFNHPVFLTLSVLGIGEFLLEYFHLFFPNNWIRLAAGLFIGVFFAVSFLRLEINFKKGY
jgi:uncharacterized membrane protein